RSFANESCTHMPPAARSAACDMSNCSTPPTSSLTAKTVETPSSPTAWLCARSIMLPTTATFSASLLSWWCTSISAYSTRSTVPCSNTGSKRCTARPSRCRAAKRRNPTPSAWGTATPDFSKRPDSRLAGWTPCRCSFAGGNDAHRSSDGRIRSGRRQTPLELGDGVEEICDLEDSIAPPHGALAQDTACVEMVHRVIRPLARAADGLRGCFDGEDGDPW